MVAAGDSIQAVGPSLASGFKAFMPLLTREEFVGLALSPTVRKLVLRRANHVDMYLSFSKALAAGSFIKLDTSDMRMSIKPHHLVQFIREIETEDECVDAARRYSTELFGGHDWHSLDYDSLANPETLPAVLHGALNHILPVSMRTEPPPSVKRVPFFKQDMAKRNDSIINFHELCAQLRSTMPRYYDMLMEGLDPSACAPTALA
jgi:hypothetical protein